MNEDQTMRAVLLIAVVTACQSAPSLAVTTSPEGPPPARADAPAAEGGHGPAATSGPSASLLPPAPIFVLRDGENSSLPDDDIRVDGVADFQDSISIGGDTVISNGEGIGWTREYRVERVSDDREAGTLEVRCWRITDEVVSDRTVRVERGGTLGLGPDLRARLVAFGHEQSSGKASPLLLDMEFIEGDTTWIDRASLHAAGDSFAWRNFRLTLLDYGYDEFIELRVETLALSPVSLVPLQD